MPALKAPQLSRTCTEACITAIKFLVKFLGLHLEDVTRDGASLGSFLNKPEVDSLVYYMVLSSFDPLSLRPLVTLLPFFYAGMQNCFIFHPYTHSGFKEATLYCHLVLLSCIPYLCHSPQLLQNDDLFTDGRIGLSHSGGMLSLSLVDQS